MSYLQKNITSLQKRYPSINWQTLFMGQTSLATSQAKNGELTFTYQNNLVHSSYNPTSDAYKSLADINTNNNKHDAIVFLGLGLAYNLIEAKKNFTNLKFYIIESDLSLLTTLFTHVDCHDLILDNNITWLLMPHSQDELINLLSTSKIAKPKIVIMRSLFNVNQELYTLYINSINSYMARHGANLATLKAHGLVWQRNFNQNKHLLQTIPFIEKIKNKFNGLPALLIGAGSSLNFYLPSLKELKEKFVLICVDTALPTLNAMNIVPDFVVAIDSQYWNYRHLDNLWNIDTIFITDICFNPSLFKKRTKTTFFIENLYAKSYQPDYQSQPSSHLKSGGSVATVGFSLAHYLGCSSLYAVGLDLCYHNGLNHVKGSRFEGWALNTCHRLNPLSTYLFSYLNMAKTYKETNVEGKPVISDERLLFYRDWFAEQSHLLACYNLSLGLNIKGFKTIKLDRINQLENCRTLVDSIKNSINLQYNKLNTKEL